YYTRPLSIRWQSNWPIPKSPIDDNFRGVLIWHSNPSGTWNFERSRQDLQIDIESAHGRWDWIIDYADSLEPPNDKRAIKSNNQNPLTGLDSLEVKYSYRWLKYEAGGYIPMSTYPDRRIGSENCFFDPLNPKIFSLESNPNSNSIANSLQMPQGRITPSGFKMQNLRLEGNSVKTDIIIGDEANIIFENATLPKGKWGMISDLTIGAGATLTIEPGTNLYFYNGSSLNINGTLIAQGTSGENIIFDFINPGSGEEDRAGIMVNEDAQAYLIYCNISNAPTGITANSNCDIFYVGNCSFDNFGSNAIQINGPHTEIPFVVNSTISNSSYGITATNLSEIVIDGNIINNTETGIFLSNVTNGHTINNYITSNQKLMPGIFLESSNGEVRGNTITGHTNGIHLGNSSPDIGANTIYDNLYHGIYVGRGSLPNMVGELFHDPPLIYPISGYNNIYENGGYTGGGFDNDGSEIFISNANVLMSKGCNSVVDNRLPGRELINTQLLMNGVGFGLPIVVYAEKNFWGDHPIYPLETRFGDLIVYYEPIEYQPCPIPDGQSGGSEELLVTTSEGEVIDTLYPDSRQPGQLSATEILYAAANTQFLSADYEAAEITYNEVANSSDSLYAKLKAYRRLFELGKLMQKPSVYFNNLYNTYTTLSQSSPDSLSGKIFSQLASLCLIGEEEYVPAIGEFDEIVQQNPGSEEAVYAEIDALTAALLVTDITLGKTAAGKYLIKNPGDYTNRINSLLKSKFGSGDKVEE
ncbi:MAG: hypothetical protein DRQ13_10800, partial [Ignavibacteriae bacterium]